MPPTAEEEVDDDGRQDRLLPAETLGRGEPTAEG